jgi:hypothetical protein
MKKMSNENCRLYEIKMSTPNRIENEVQYPWGDTIVTNIQRGQ